MAVQTPLRVTPEEYLALERDAEYRSEYRAGEIVAMAGATQRHNHITRNLGRILDECLDEEECEVFTTDMRVLAGPSYTYPDVAVVCAEPRFADGQRDILINPIVIMEVSSPSTEKYDRTEKFARYKQIASLREYLLIAQDRPEIEHNARQPDGSWLSIITRGVDAVVTVGTLECPLPLKQVYRKIAFSGEGS